MLEKCVDPKECFKVSGNLILFLGPPLLPRGGPTLAVPTASLTSERGTEEELEEIWVKRVPGVQRRGSVQSVELWLQGGFWNSLVYDTHYAVSGNEERRREGEERGKERGERRGEERRGRRSNEERQREMRRPETTHEREEEEHQVRGAEQCRGEVLREDTRGEVRRREGQVRRGEREVEGVDGEEERGGEGEWTRE
ncbi:hypothetical protein NHX12_030811 [Muraenolepis orangiensis]|uniref:Uncharacterized protein n=1 Tax=Muraenolepis orangiensis TaxID=630683 RepID=A0A9Q0E8E6_9TELE|nr:hypothetical protein NHX12_030811 [Muraenolepis orangiensis]